MAARCRKAAVAARARRSWRSLAVVVALVLVALPASDSKYAHRHFPRTVSLYEGSDVRILGVQVGKVETVEPAGTDVNVKMYVRREVRGAGRRQGRHHRPVGRRRPVRPAHPGLQAGGATLRGQRACSTTDRTADPARARPDLPEPRRPDRRARPGRRQQGRRARPDLLDVHGRATSAARAQQFHQTIDEPQQVHRARSTTTRRSCSAPPARSSGFVEALAENDQTVRRFNDSLAAAADLLAGRARRTSRRRCRTSASRCRQVSRFVKENRDAAVAATSRA